MFRTDQRRRQARGFTLVELLAVIAVISLLAALVVPVVTRARAAGQGAACTSNLRQMQMAYTMYLADHEGRLFEYEEGTTKGKTLYYFGLASQGAEGSRPIDKSKAKLAPYFEQIGGVEICPAIPYRAPYFKQKFDMASYGYGINAYFLTDVPVRDPAQRVVSFSQIRRPSETIAWGDAIQVNVWQAPASPQRPMLEEWYWLDANAPPKFHFRHGGQANVVMADGHVCSFKPERLDARCDGLSGYIEPPGEDYHLRPVK